MFPGTSDLRGLTRRSSVVDVRVQPTTGATPASQTSGTSRTGSGFNAPGALTRRPVVVSRKPLLKLSGFARQGGPVQQKIVEFLSFREAIVLMLASTDLYRLIQADPWFRQDDLSASLMDLRLQFNQDDPLCPSQELALSELVQSLQSLEAEISRLQHPPESVRQAVALPEAAGLGVRFAAYCLNVQLARLATKAAKADVEARQVQVRGKEAEVALIATRLQAFGPPIEGVVIHYVEERLNRPRLGRDLGAPANAHVTPADVQAAAVPGDVLHGTLNNAIENGDIARARLLVHQVLNLPAALMSSARKLDRLVLQPGGPLEFFGQHASGLLKPAEQRQYEAIRACAKDIVSAEFFSAAEEAKLRAKLAGIVRAALGSDQPAVVASLLEGISGLKFFSQREELKLRTKLAAIFQHKGSDDPYDLVPSILDDIIRLKYFVPTRKKTLQMEVERICRRSTRCGDPELVPSLLNEIANSKVFCSSEEANLHTCLCDICEREMGIRDPELAASIRDEIISSSFFSPPEEMKLISKLVDICRIAMGGRYKNPPLAASILLGVHESSASPGFKHSCLAAICDGHEGAQGFVEFVHMHLSRYRRHASEWVDGMAARLEGLKQAMQASGDGTLVLQPVT